MKTPLHNFYSFSLVLIFSSFLSFSAQSQIVAQMDNSLMVSATQMIAAYLPPYTEKSSDKYDMSKVSRDFLSIGLGLYSDAQWETAGLVMSKYLENFPLESDEGKTALFHLALCHLNLGDYPMAASRLESLRESGTLSPSLLSEVEYVEAMVWCQLNMQDGLAKMRQIADTASHPHAMTAKGILGEI